MYWKAFERLALVGLMEENNVAYHQHALNRNQRSLELALGQPHLSGPWWYVQGESIAGQFHFVTVDRIPIGARIP